MGRPGNLVNRHLSRFGFLIKPIMLLTRKNPLKSSGFYTNRVTRLGYCNLTRFAIFIKITLLDHFSIFILFKIELFGNYQLIKNYKELKNTLLGLFFYFYNLFGCCNLIFYYSF
jgi:hypothetical protein